MKLRRQDRKLESLLVTWASRPCPSRKESEIVISEDANSHCDTACTGETPVSQLAARMACALIAITLAGCKFKPEHNMEEQPTAHPAYKATDAFPDGTTARPVPYGTVPRAPADSAGFAFADLRKALPAMTASAAETDVVPFPITREILLRGQERFRIFCSVCHGRLGDGNGMITQRGLTPPPSFHIDRLRQVSDGHLYNVISNGYGQMFSYNDRVGPEDRWMIVAYIRALQAGMSEQNQAKLTNEERKNLQGSRP
jgi:mono/diheme cytochrome c family protein